MILLDTAAIIIIGDGKRLRAAAIEAILAAEAAKEPIYVSAATVWELCLLERLRRTGPLLGYDGASFFRSVVDEMRLAVIDLNAEIAIESRRLPGHFHEDPADRFIIATARLRRLTLVTSDRPVLDYANQGHVEAIRC